MSSINEIPRQVIELCELIVEYLKSQTLKPLKRIIRYISLGISGAFFMAIGLFLLSIGFLRYLQTLSTFDASLSFAPYLIVALADSCAVGILFVAMTSKSLIPPASSKRKK